MKRPDLDALKLLLEISNGCGTLADKLIAMVAYVNRLEREAAAMRKSRELFLDLTQYLHHEPGCDSIATLPGDCACGLRGRMQAALAAEREGGGAE